MCEIKEIDYAALFALKLHTYPCHVMLIKFRIIVTRFCIGASKQGSNSSMYRTYSYTSSVSAFFYFFLA